MIHRESVQTLLKADDVFSHLESMTDQRIKKVYGAVRNYGPELIGNEHTDRTLNLISYELNRRENRKAFIQMRWLTIIAIGLSLVQVIMGIVDKL